MSFHVHPLIGRLGYWIPRLFILLFAISGATYITTMVLRYMAEPAQALRATPREYIVSCLRGDVPCEGALLLLRGGRGPFVMTCTSQYMRDRISYETLRSMIQNNDPLIDSFTGYIEPDERSIYPSQKCI